MGRWWENLRVAYLKLGNLQVRCCIHKELAFLALNGRVEPSQEDVDDLAAGTLGHDQLALYLRAQQRL